jgi:hypothetical protein
VSSTLRAFVERSGGGQQALRDADSDAGERELLCTSLAAAASGDADLPL